MTWLKKIQDSKGALHQKNQDPLKTMFGLESERLILNDVTEKNYGTKYKPLTSQPQVQKFYHHLWKFQIWNCL